MKKTLLRGNKFHLRNIQIFEFHELNPEMNATEIGKRFGLKRSQICNILTLYKPSELKINVVPSFYRENTYFIFNGVNEKMFETDSEKKILKIYSFDNAEKIELIKLGFKI